MKACALETNFGVYTLMAFPKGEVELFADVWAPREEDDNGGLERPQAFSLADGLRHELQASTRRGFGGQQGIGAAGMAMLGRVTTGGAATLRQIRMLASIRKPLPFVNGSLPFKNGPSFPNGRPFGNFVKYCERLTQAIQKRPLP
jgi:hypothetical protein